MDFKKTFEMMLAGFKIKLPEWKGYWYWDFDKKTIIIHCFNDTEFDIRKTSDVAFTISNILRNDWEIYYEKAIEAEVGFLYRHYKNKKVYCVIDLGIDTETEQEVVAYREYDPASKETKPLWIRPKKMFESFVLSKEGNKIPRFKKCELSGSSLRRSMILRGRIFNEKWQG